jgi:hypothetical protein
MPISFKYFQYFDSFDLMSNFPVVPWCPQVVKKLHDLTVIPLYHLSNSKKNQGYCFKNFTLPKAEENCLKSYHFKIGGQVLFNLVFTWSKTII